MSALRFSVQGPLAQLSAAARETLMRRECAVAFAAGGDVAARVAEIVRRVWAEGDHALREFARTFDGATLEQLEVPRAAWDLALAALDPTLRCAMERAASNIRAVHSAFAPVASETRTPDGVTIGRRPDPFARVGVYAPGGRATYPSSLLMGAIPARLAGVGEVIVCSPPSANGRPEPIVLAAAAIAGADRLFAVGGAGAIAAMAYGTPSIPRVDRIVGPGNAYVAEAKEQLSRLVAIDSPAGPSELLILADRSASPRVVAGELLAQAEHDPDAAVVLVTDAPPLAAAVIRDLEARVDAEPRAAIIRDALARRGAVLTTSSLDDGIEFANAWSPEHLLLSVRPEAELAALAKLRNVGTIFTGEGASVVFGDYLSGANHVLPTGGSARRYSGLSTDDFVRWTTWQRIDRDAASAMARDTGAFADAEGLPAHAAAARQWAVA